jgi:lysophospholipase L1-like esterase
MSFNMTVNGAPTYGPAKYGNGLTAVSDANYLSIPNGPIPSASSPWAVEGWLSTTETTLTRILLSLGGALFLGTNGGQFQLYLYSSFIGSGVISDGAQHHWALSCDGAGNYGLFLDGVSKVYGNRSGAFSNANFTLGRNTAGSNQFWAGTIDDVAVHNYNKYPTNISFTPPAAPFTGAESGLVALYHLEADGTDSSGAVAPVVAGSITANTTTSSSITPKLNTISGGTAPYSTAFSYCTTTNGTYTPLGTPVTGTSPVANATLSGLSPTTTIFFRAVVTDSAGTAQVVTFPSSTTGTPLTTASAALAAGTITANVPPTGTTIKPQLGTISGGTAPYSTVFSYSTSTNGTYTPIGTPVNGANPIANAFATGLTPLTPYFLRAVVTDAASAVVTIPSSSTGTSISTSAASITTSFPALTTPQINFFGPWAHDTSFVYSGSGMDFTFTGSGFKLNARITATNPITMTVNGGSPTTPTLPITGSIGFVDLIPAGTLTEGTYTIHLDFTTNAVLLDLVNSIYVTGAAPAVGYPTGFGQQYTAFDYPNAIRTEGGWKLSSPAPYSQVWANSYGVTDGRADFAASCSGLAFWMVLAGQKVRLLIDGVPSGTVQTVPNTSTWGRYVLPGSYDGNPHVYGMQTCGGQLSIFSVMAIGGTLNLSAVPAARKIVSAIGDSITKGEIGTGGDTSQSWVSKLGLLANIGVYNVGVNSQSCHQFTTEAAGENPTRITDITAVPPTPNVVCVMYGTNDASQNGGAQTAAQFQASYWHMMDQLTTGLPTTKFLCISMVPASNATITSNRPSFNAAAHLAITTGGDGGSNVLSAGQQARIFWVDSDTANLNISTDYAGDGTHPNGAGCTKIAAVVNAALAPLLLSAHAGNVSGNVQKLTGGMQG